MQSTATHIPFHKPFCAPQAERTIQSALRSGKWAGNGPFAQKCRQRLAELFQGASVFLTPSCTAALEMAACILGIQPGDEVIVPAFTFVSSASGFALFGARPVFVDVDPRTLNLDPDLLEAAITPRTRAIVPVHYAGVACDMEKIMQIAARHGVEVVEDNAHGLFGSLSGRFLGTFGSLSTLSFHETKNVSCGEGGALILNRPDWVEKAEIAQEKGTNRSRFLMGLIDKYTWVSPGSSYLLSDLNAALLWANLEEMEPVQRHRLELWERYQTGLRDWCRQHGVEQPHVPGTARHPAHLYYLLLPDLEKRQQLMMFLRSQNIQAAYHYQPLHTSPMGLAYGGGEADCPVAVAAANRLIRLPLYAGLKFEEQDRILELIRDWSWR
ncbi:MAG: dTDP-4-amino-4,6-dideoxygalactose transaminase [Candidatus Eremiobacteraeota bacterium]|nr:dTDP-4-amino-4,6-dideoxygalactose transaminase [Candidatus Eremiobacteraeota bacterium]MCW5870072.1 dTDP-4-amino-4,6-dideoxygalactose transaminase [Candidatus Eremiobacteraeota bacterium]